VLTIKTDWLIVRQPERSSDAAGCVAIKTTCRPKIQPGTPKNGVADTLLSSPGGSTYYWCELLVQMFAVA